MRFFVCSFMVYLKYKYKPKTKNMISTHKRKTRSSFIFFLILSLATAYTPQHAVAASIMPTAGAYHATPTTHANTQSNYQATGFSAADYTSVASDDSDFLTTTATATAPQGETKYASPGTYSWTAPAGVTSVSAVCVGGGCAGYGTNCGGGGGGLGWKNDIAVTPGNSYTVVVGAGGYMASGTSGKDPGESSYFIDTSAVRGGGGNIIGGSFTGDGGGNGGSAGCATAQYYGGYGGGAGGYTGNGGTGGNGPGSAGSGGGGGGGAEGAGSGAGGGVGLYGQGANGAGGAAGSSYQGGKGGSGGTNASSGPGIYGGGSFSAGTHNWRSGGNGACRIIWGPNRAFPSTNTGSLPTQTGAETYASQFYTFDASDTISLASIKINLLAYGTANAGNGITAKIWNTNTAAWEELTGLSNTDSTMPTIIDTQNITENIQNYIDINNEIKILIHTTNPSTGTTNAVLNTDYLKLTLLEQDITIQSPDPSKITNATNDGYFTLNTGTVTNTDSVTAQVNITLTNNGKEVTFPQNTTIQETNTNPFNFQNFTLESQNIKNEQPESRSAFRLGIEGTNLTFSQPITITTFIGEAFNTQTLDILYQNEGETTWNTQGTCTVENGQCTFQTDHATIYTINGTLQSTGDAPLNINTEVLDTLTMDCYESTNGSGTYDVLLGTVSNPGYVTAGTPAIGQSTCTVTTNDDQGYYLTVEDDNGISSTVLTHTDPNTGAIYEIQDLTPWNDTTLTTENWNPPTTKGLGFSVITFPDTDTANNIFDGIWTNTGNCPEGTTPDSNDYAGIPDTPETIAAVPQYTANHTTTNICYKVDVPTSQPSGTYTGSVTYTATSDASSYLN
jgi:hypothetical protein